VRFSLINAMKFKICAFIFATVLSFVVSAQDARTISLVVPFSAGSAQDIVARLVSEPLGQELQTRVVVINKPGAGGTIASAFVANAKPDGQTYLLASSSHHLAGALHSNLSYHPLDNFRGAAFLGFSEFVLVASASMQTSDISTFISRVKANPKSFNYASAGNGSTTHVGMAGFLHAANLEMTHIPLKGTGEIINEVLSGRVQAAMVSALSISAYRDDARIKLLATSGIHRSEFFQNLPTLSESVHAKYKWVVWAGLLAPAATPVEKMEDINRAMMRVINDPAMKIRFMQLGISPKSMPRSQFDSVLKEDWAQSGAVMARLKNYLD
jgi:tripartite-type tricarboxylate transporter receptor subunit TctC